ncbi:MAG: hypothetical protein V1736_12815 [Pseudomonadota bacterium]
MGALSVGDVRTGTIPSLLPSQKHYLKAYSRCHQRPAIPVSAKRQNDVVWELVGLRMRYEITVTSCWSFRPYSSLLKGSHTSVCSPLKQP